MNKLPLVSIIIPFYNVAPYIKRCLQCVDNQTYQNIEVLLINDKTPDNSQEIATLFINQESKNPNQYKVIEHIENKGLSGARNTGMQHAVGDYIFFIDSDDYIDTQCIENHVKSIKNQFDISIGSHQRITHSGEVVYDETLKEDIETNNVIDFFTQFPFYSSYPMAWNKLYKREFLLKHKMSFTEKLLSEDIMWIYELYAKNPKIVTSKNALYYYIVDNQNSIMNNIKQKHLEDYLRIVQKMNQICDNTSQPLLNYLETYKNDFIIDVCKNNKANTLVDEDFKKNFEKKIRKNINYNYFFLWKTKNIRQLKKMFKFQFNIT